MLDHVSLGISSLERSRRFYDAALAPLGIKRLADFDERGSDYGVGSAPLGVEFSITREAVVRPASGMHLCFRAADRQAVIAFHNVATRCGGTCDGEPGIRPMYHPDYFATFVLDPDGHRIEVVCHAPGSVHAGRTADDFVAVSRGHGVRIRRALDLDADIVTKLARAFHAEDGHPLSDVGVRALVLMLEVGFTDGLVLLLEVDGTVCGYGVLSFGYGIEHGGRETFLEDIYIDPKSRGAGFGALLIDELEKRAREAGCKAIHLEVMPGNRAEHWYRRLGWSDRGSQLLAKAI